MLPDQLQQPRVDGGPDAVLAFGAILVLVGETRHVLDRDLDRDLHRLQPPGVDDRHLAAGAAEEAPDLLQWTLRRGQADALGLDLGHLAQALQAQREMAAPLGRRHGVDLVDDQPAHGREDAAGGAGEDEEQRFGRGDEDVGRVTLHRAPDVGGRVAGADGDLNVGRLQTLGLDLPADADERRA